MRVLNHVVHPIEACTVKVAWGVLRVGRSSHPQLYAGQDTYLLEQAARGTRESHMSGALLASLEAGRCMPTACSLAERESI